MLESDIKYKVTIKHNEASSVFNYNKINLQFTFGNLTLQKIKISIS